MMDNKQTFRILIVDDEAANLHILNQILKGDYTIYAARSGITALKTACERKPDLILLDVILPDISGFEVLSELKSADATRDIPVIIISALSRGEDVKKSFRLGAADYITKPFNSLAVKEKIEAQFKQI